MTKKQKVTGLILSIGISAFCVFCMCVCPISELIGMTLITVIGVGIITVLEILTWRT